ATTAPATACAGLGHRPAGAAEHDPRSKIEDSAHPRSGSSTDEGGIGRFVFDARAETSKAAGDSTVHEFADWNSFVSHPTAAIATVQGTPLVAYDHSAQRPPMRR